MNRLMSILGAFVTVLTGAAVVALFLISRPAPAAPADSRSARDAAAPQAAVGAAGPVGEKPSAPKPGECLIHHTTYDRVLPTIDQEKRQAPVAVVGTIVSVGEARWNTADGREPAEDRPPSATDLYRLVTIAPESDLWGGKLPATLDVRLPGGTIGCQVYVLEEIPEVAVGDRLVFFASTRPSSAGPEYAEPLVLDAWPVAKDGTVQTPEDGSVSVARLGALFSSP